MEGCSSSKRQRVEELVSYSDFFASHCTLAWELIAKPHLSLAERSRLARAHRKLYDVFRKKDESLQFLTCLWNVPHMSGEDRLRAVKRSGLLECLKGAWTWVTTKTRVPNDALMLDWIIHGVASGNLQALRWMFAQTIYTDDEWTVLPMYTTEVMLKSPGIMEQHAFDMALNLGSVPWWDTQFYARDMRTTDGQLMLAICFIVNKRYDLLDRLVNAPHWHEPLDEQNRYAIGLIAAVRSESLELFTCWWNSPQCHAMQRALPSTAPNPRDCLRFVLVMMAGSPDQANNRAAELLAPQLQQFL